MSSKKNAASGNKKIWIAFAVFAVVILTASLALHTYFKDSYPAGRTAMDALVSDSAVTVTIEKNKSITFSPAGSENPSAGLIFYPGGKVEYEAYAPLMHTLAENGFLCILVHMPLNLAVFDPDAADGYREQYPEIARWYIGGHSLGGAMAASYAGKHADEFDGLILLAAYSASDLSGSSLTVLSLYGSNDGVLNREKYEKNKENLPADFKEEIIEGGCHAYFGSYGAQKGDGTPSITNEEQIQTAADFICYYLK